MKNVDRVAFDQEELSDLLDIGISHIYLFKGEFRIPISRENITYIGIDSPVVIVKSKTTVDFSSKNIIFKNVSFNEGYAQVENDTKEKSNSKRVCSGVIGIDLGTTNSCVAVMEGGKPVIISNAEGSRITPSIVSWQVDGKRVVGQAAKMQTITNNGRTVSSIARQLGNDYKVNIDGRGLTSQEILATILQKLKKDAESYIGEAVTEAVITIPTCYGYAEKQAIIDAATIAGLRVCRCITPTLAAAISYGIDKFDYTHKILVCDMGGGTLGISILELGDGLFEVKSVNGNIKLGGDDFDERIVNFVADTFKIDNGIDLRKDKVALSRLKEASEMAKIKLSSSMQTAINLPFICSDATGQKHITINLTRTKFNELTGDLVMSTIESMKNVFRDSKVSISEIDKIILVGGSTRIPAIIDAVRKFTCKEPSRVKNSDECVAVGAAIEAGILSGMVKDILPLDVTPLTLGIVTKEGIATEIIKRCTTIPAKKSEMFSTATDGQTSFEIHVVQGEFQKASDNKTLGRFTLTGISPAPKGIPQIEVTFDIDANGTLEVFAKDKGTGKEVSMVINGSINFNNDEMDEAVCNGRYGMKLLK
ncbi:molecular chaperone DnaK [Clostridium estertheticum]|nr:molecular chaperone DnaK [Clostridium estertheticum]